jgi:hypothetical protein
MHLCITYSFGPASTEKKTKEAAVPVARASVSQIALALPVKEKQETN